MSKTVPTIALTIDVEDWAQSSWDRTLPISDYCADNAQRVLEIITEFPSAKATFFILGKFAEKHPHIVKDIHQAGYEIGSHGWGHVEIFRLTKNKFREDIKLSTNAIEDITGVRPIGYRAPDFSIVGETLWALDILAEEGYVYDSSILPIGKGRYGIRDWPRTAGLIKSNCGSDIIEFPLATLELFGRRFPIGGGYARLMPQTILLKALNKTESQLETPVVFYCHPYETDPLEFDRLEFKVPFKVRLHQTIGRKRTISKLRQLIKNFNCISLSQAVTQCKDLAVIDRKSYILDPGSVTRPPIF